MVRSTSAWSSLCYMRLVTVCHTKKWLLKMELSHSISQQAHIAQYLKVCAWIKLQAFYWPKRLKTHMDSSGYCVQARWNSGDARDNEHHTLSSAVLLVCNQCPFFKLRKCVPFIAWLTAFSLLLKAAGQLYRNFSIVPLPVFALTSNF